MVFLWFSYGFPNFFDVYQRPSARTPLYPPLRCRRFWSSISINWSRWSKPILRPPLSETRMSEKARNIPRNGHIDKLYIIYTITYIYISDTVDISPKWINSWLMMLKRIYWKTIEEHVSCVCWKHLFFPVMLFGIPNKWCKKYVIDLSCTWNCLFLL